MEGHPANDILKKFFKAHSIDIAEESGWIVPNSTLPAIRSTWYPNEDHLSGLLQIEVYLEGGRVLEECFAGLPNESGKLNDAFENFARNSFHVMMSAFWKKHDAEQVDIENWNIDGKDYVVYLGPFGNRGGEGIEPRIPINAFEQIERTIKKSDISNDYHWFRNFFCNTGNNDNVYESLKDNENWDEGLSTLKAIEWTKSDQFYSTRNFIILKKNTNGYE